MATTRRAIVCLSRRSIKGPVACSYTPRLSPQRGIRHFQASAKLNDALRPAQPKNDVSPKVVRGQSKVFKDADEAVADIKSGSMILSAGFGLCGTAGTYSVTSSRLIADGLCGANLCNRDYYCRSC